MEAGGLASMTYLSNLLVGRGWIVAVAVDAAEAVPALFVAVAITFTVAPASALVSVYGDVVVFVMSIQVDVHRCHCNRDRGGRVAEPNPVRRGEGRAGGRGAGDDRCCGVRLERPTWRSRSRR